MRNDIFKRTFCKKCIPPGRRDAWNLVLQEFHLALGVGQILHHLCVAPVNPKHRFAVVPQEGVDSLIGRYPPGSVFQQFHRPELARFLLGQAEAPGWNCNPETRCFRSFSDPPAG